MKIRNISYANPFLRSLTQFVSLLGIATTSIALVPEPGNVYYGFARDMFGKPLLSNSGAQVIMTRKDTTNEYVIAVSEIFPTIPGGRQVNYVLRPSLDDGVGARYSTDTARSNDVVQIFIVIGGFRYAVTNTPGCINFSDPVPRIGGRGAVQSANLKANDDFDGNCLSDSWEIMYWGSTLARPGDDDDGDGYTNLAEYMAGTNPLDPDSNPDTLGLNIQIVSVGTNTVTLDWPTFAGVPATLLWSTNVARGYTNVPSSRLSGDSSNEVNTSGATNLFFRTWYSFPQ